MSLADKPILQLKDISFSYSKSRFIEGLNLNVHEAEFIGLLGANGSGKSSILKLLCGILKPHSGAVHLWGKPIVSFKNKDRAKLISYLPQVLDMSISFKCKELAEMGLYPYEIPPSMGIDSALNMVGLSDKKESLISNLSGGERRRAFIAMTLMQGAGVLLLDEPLQNLDIKYQIEIIRLLKMLNKDKGITILMALHDINLAFQFKRLILIKEGRLMAEGTPHDVLDEALLKDAFETEITVKRNGTETYISYMD